MVKPVIEYASSVSPPYAKANIVLVEAVQRRAAKFVTWNYRLTSSVTEILQSLG